MRRCGDVLSRETGRIYRKEDFARGPHSRSPPVLSSRCSCLGPVALPHRQSVNWSLRSGSNELLLISSGRVSSVPSGRTAIQEGKKKKACSMVSINPRGMMESTCTFHSPPVMWRSISAIQQTGKVSIINRVAHQTESCWTVKMVQSSSDTIPSNHNHYTVIESNCFESILWFG